MQGNINIPDSTITTNLSFRQLVLMNMQQLTNFPYIEKDFDALTDYELLSLVVKFLNDVIANQNKQNDSITRMYQSFLALQDYVNNTKDKLEDAFNNLDDYVRNYFDNLDVQEEINNKLDQMLEDGVLEQIIEQFIQSTALWCFDTVDDMKLATNFINGSIVKTLGYYNINDGGGAEYIISDTESELVHQEELNSGLYANLIEKEEMNSKQYGINNNSDISDFLNYIASSNVKKLKVNNGNYSISSTVNFNKSIDIDFDNSTITSNCASNTLIFQSTLKATTSLYSNYTVRDQYFTVINTENMNIGDLIVIGNQEVFSTKRNYYLKGITSTIKEIKDSNVFISDKLPYNLLSTNSTVKVYENVNVNIKNLKLIGENTLTTSTQQFGITLLHCNNSSLENVYIDNFLYNGYILESDFININNLSTNRSVVSGIEPGSAYNAYGIALNGSNINIKNSSFNSGQHGITHTNAPAYPYTSYNITIDNCIIKSEQNRFGFGSHANAINTIIKNSTCYGFTAEHNTTFENCILYSMGSTWCSVVFTDQEEFTNYKFNNCKFYTSPYTENELPLLRITSFESNENSLDKINNIELNNCENAYLLITKRTVMKDNANINNILIYNSKNIAIKQESLFIGNLLYKNNEYNYNFQCFNILGNINNIVVEDCKIYPRYNVMLFSGTSMGNILLNNIDFRGEGYSPTNSINFTTACNSINLKNVISDFSHFRILFDYPSDLLIENCIGDCRTNFNTFTDKKLTVKNSKLKSTTLTEIVTNNNLLHFTKEIDNTGNVTYTLIQ